VARSIAGGLPSDTAMLIEHDAYYRDRPDLSYDQRCQLNYDHPDALETQLLIEHLQTLRRGEPVEIPIYDFSKHRRSDERRRVEPGPVIIVEGILVFADERLRENFDLKVFVDTDADIRAFRRIRRDIEQRGRTFQSVREQYYATVRPMHLQFVEPSKRWADVIVPEGGENLVAVELLVSKLKSVVAAPAR
jgi:uridine kinase